MFKKSKQFDPEYCCAVIRVGPCSPIPDTDKRLVAVDGMDVVVDESVTQGDIMIYASNETQLDYRFLAANNLFCQADCLLNDDRKKPDDDTATGFFTYRCRVRLTRQHGICSYGFLFKPEMLERAFPELKGFDYAAAVGTRFDTIGDTLFARPYMSRVKGSLPDMTHVSRQTGTFDRVIDDRSLIIGKTPQLQQNMGRFHGNDIVTVTVQMNGVSVMMANVTGNTPLRLNWRQRLWNRLAKAFHAGKDKLFPDTARGHVLLYGNRGGILNSHVDRHGNETPQENIWSHCFNRMRDFIPKDTVVFGEIVGYYPGTARCIQPQYDYGVPVGEYRLVPLRVLKSGREMTVTDVVKWTCRMKRRPQLKNLLTEMRVLYHGKLKSLYPYIKPDDSYGTNVLRAMRQDNGLLGMDMREPLCVNDVPREGVNIRRHCRSGKISCKLKADSFMLREGKMIDDGQFNPETMQSLPVDLLPPDLQKPK